VTGQLALSWSNAGGWARSQAFYMLLHNYNSPKLKILFKAELCILILKKRISCGKF